LNARPDSTADVLWRKADGAVGFWSLEGTEFGSETTIAQPVGTQYRVEAIGDLSGDGTEDILWRDTTTGKVALWLMESKTFKTAEFAKDTNANLIFADQNWQVHGIADFDGDGKGDVLWRHKASQSFAVWYMDGTAMKSAKIFSGIDNAWDIKGTGDFNGDGKAEILWRNTTDNRVAMGSVTATSHAFTDMKYGGVNVLVGQDFTVEAIADFGGDGKSDILWRNSAGKIAVWEMNGALVANPNMVKDPKTGAEIVISRDDWGIVGAEYLGNDNRADILWRNKQDGKWAVWQMNSATLQTGSFLKEVATWQDLSKTPAGMAGRPAAIDEAGNTTGTAFNVGSLTTQASFQGSVDAWDAVDLYRFDVSGPQVVSVRLDGMVGRSTNQNLDMTLFGSNGITVLGESKNPGVQSELIQAGLESGTYYVQVKQATATDFNQYKLSLTTVPLGTLNFGVDALGRSMDTGSSQTDGVTKNAKPSFQGSAPAGSLLRLYGTKSQTLGAQPVLLGSVTVGDSGSWSIQSPELEDGAYQLVAKMVLSNGMERVISQGLGVTIDTVKPNLQMSDLIDGIAWGNGESLRGDLVDRDDLSRVQYWFANAPLLKSDLAVVGGKVSGTLTLPAGIAAFTKQTVVFRSWDRAGNEQTNAYDFMVFEEGNGLDSPDTFGSAVADELTVRPGRPRTSGTGGKSIYVNALGEWGYWGLGSGGTGGTGGAGGIWTPVTFSPSSWANAGPEVGYDPDGRLTYVEAVRAIAETARDVLSSSPKTQHKKYQMGQEVDDLTHLARFVRDNNLYNVMGDSFHGLYGDLYGRLTNNTIARKQATVMGLELAQKLATDKLQVSWKAFKAEVWATTYKGLNLGVASMADRTNVQTAMNGLSETYYRISQNSGRGSYFNELLSYSLANDETEIGEKFVMGEFEQLFKDQKAPTSAIAAIKLSDRLLQASRRVVDLNVKWPIGGPETFLNWSGMTSGALLELGFEIARSNPTVTSGENPMSEWIETLIELPDGVSAADKARKEKGLRSVAGGLSEWFDGFDLGPLLADLSSDGYNGRNRMPGTLQKAIEYAGRLVQAARAIDDVNLVGEAKKADFLSHLVNLGGAYASIRPEYSNGSIYAGLTMLPANVGGSSTSLVAFLDAAYRDATLSNINTANRLEDALSAFSASPTNFLEFSNQALQEYEISIRNDPRQTQLRKIDYIEFFLEKNTNFAILAQGAGVFARPRNPNQGPPPPDKCKQLLYDMIVHIVGGLTQQFPARNTNISRGLDERYWQLRRDSNKLYRDYYSLNTPKPGVGSWIGHQKIYQELRENVGKLIEAWERENCDNHNGGLGSVTQENVKRAMSIVRVYGDLAPPEKPDYVKSSNDALPMWELPDWIFWIPRKLGEMFQQIV
jgi:Bacterial Ig-like domain/Bacterial pre-peptidase C-terminal domain/FG-GAP-like repeat